MDNAIRSTIPKWSHPLDQYTVDCRLHDFFEASLREHPDRTAVIAGATRISYLELDSLTDELAFRLQSMGVGPETVVGVLTTRSIAMVTGFLGVLKSGGAYLPLDPSLPEQRLQFMIEDAAADIVVCEPDVATSGIRASGGFVDIPISASDRCGIRLTDVVTRNNIAYVVYTSGTSGKPKGVEVEHRNIANTISWYMRRMPVGSTDTVAQTISVGFDGATREIFAALAVGATLTIVPDDVRHSPHRLAEWITKNEITAIAAVSNIAEDIIKDGRLRRSALKLLISGAAIMPYYPGKDVHFECVNVYGPTECAVVATAAFLNNGTEFDRPPIGRPIGNMWAYVLDEEMQFVDVGETGELYLAGDGVARGYVGRPDLTRELFLADPYVPGRTMYRTGDLVRVEADSQLSFIGRRDQQVNLSGYRIELAEIEHAIRDLDGARCVARLWAPPGGAERLVAFVEKGRHGLSSEGIRERLSSRLPHYMVPTNVILVDVLAVGPNGKVDRNALDPEPFLARKNDQVRSESSTLNDLGSVIRDVWERIFAFGPIDFDDNFFLLGGHSIMAIDAARWIGDELGIEVPLEWIFMYPTPRLLADHVTATGWTD